MKKINILISVFFVFLLCIPALITLQSKHQETSTSEKRQLAPFPKFTWSYNSMKKFPKEFNKYFEDHFGLRSAIVRFHNFFFCKVLGVSPSKMVIVGKKGWYFLDMENSVFDYFGLFQYDKILLEKAENVLQDRKKWLASLGIHYLFVPVPNKEMIYEEYLPDRMKIYKGKNKYTQIIDYLNSNYSFSEYIDTQKVLLAHKNRGELYYRTDSHWNDYGSFVLSREILNRLQQWLPEIESLPEMKVGKATEKYSGDLSVIMNLAGLVKEKIPKRQRVEICQTRGYQKLSEIYNIPEYKDFPEQYLPITTGCNDKKYNAILIHDSFGHALKPYLSQYFGEIIFANWMNFEYAKFLIEKKRPDIVIDLRVARNIEKALHHDPELEQFVLEKDFEETAKDLYKDHFSEIQKEASSRGNVKIKKTNNSLYIQFEKLHSVILLPVKILSQMVREIDVEITVYSPKNTEMDFCYEPRNTTKKSSNQCQRRTLLSGENQLFLRVLRPTSRGLFVAAPTETGIPGEYKISSFAIRTKLAKSP